MNSIEEHSDSIVECEMLGLRVASLRLMGGTVLSGYVFKQDINILCFVLVQTRKAENIPSQHDLKTVVWDVKPNHKQTEILIQFL